MNTYYLRCRQSRYPTLVSRGIRMGAIQEQNGIISPVGPGAWDYVGTKILPDKTLAGGCEDPYVHINLRTEHNLRKLALIASATDQDIADGFAEIVDYFITNGAGEVVAPEFPMRIFL